MIAATGVAEEERRYGQGLNVERLNALAPWARVGVAEQAAELAAQQRDVSNVTALSELEYNEAHREALLKAKEREAGADRYAEVYTTLMKDGMVPAEEIPRVAAQLAHPVGERDVDYGNQNTGNTIGNRIEELERELKEKQLRNQRGADLRP